MTDKKHTIRDRVQESSTPIANPSAADTADRTAEGAPRPRLGELPTETVPMRHPGRTFAAAVLLFLVAVLVHSLITNPHYEWNVVWKFLFHAQILQGLGRTLLLTGIAMLIGIVLGIVLATFRMSANKVLSTFAGAWLWFFRGTPLLIQLIFWYNLSALYPRLAVGMPFGGPELFGAATNSVLTLWSVALIGLSLHESAYMAEIVRGGLMSIPRHQSEAANALGMNGWLTFRRIVLPQALRVIVPPTGNQVIGMLKYSSLVSVIAMPDLLYSAQLIYSETFQTIPLLIAASIWYLLATTVLSFVQRYIERYYGRGVAGPPRPPTKPWGARLGGFGFGFGRTAAAKETGA